jgi:hypothetical protein
VYAVIGTSLCKIGDLGQFQVSALQFNVAERKGYMAQSLYLLQRLVQAVCHDIGLQRLIQAPQLSFNMAQRQEALHLLARSDSGADQDGPQATLDPRYNIGIYAIPDDSRVFGMGTQCP